MRAKEFISEKSKAYYDFEKATIYWLKSKGDFAWMQKNEGENIRGIFFDDGSVIVWSGDLLHDEAWERIEAADVEPASPVAGSFYWVFGKLYSFGDPSDVPVFQKIFGDQLDDLIRDYAELW